MAVKLFKLFKPMMQFQSTNIDTEIVGFIPVNGDLVILHKHSNGRNWITNWGDVYHPSYFMYVSEWWSNSTLGFRELTILRAILYPRGWPS